MDTIITNFFSEGITRLIPGIALLVVVYGKDLAARATAFSAATIPPTICILLLAWLVGATLDVVFFSVFMSLLNFLGQYCRLAGFFRDLVVPNCQPRRMGDRKSGNAIQTDVKCDGKGDGKESEPAKFERLQGIRRDSEKVLFRSMGIVFLIAFIFKPLAFSNVGWTHWFSIIAAGGFFGCWYFYVWAKKKEGEHEMGEFIGYSDTGVWASNQERVAVLDWFAFHRCKPHDKRWHYCKSEARRWTAGRIQLAELVPQGELFEVSDSERAHASTEFSPHVARLLGVIGQISQGKWPHSVTSKEAVDWRDS